MSAALTTREQHDLSTLEEIIGRGIRTFIDVGRALAEVRDRRLYRDSHGTFEEYAHERWLLSRTRVPVHRRRERRRGDVHHGGHAATGQRAAGA